MNETLSLVLLAISTIMAVSGGLMARHAARNYRLTNEVQAGKRHDDQVLANAVILGVKDVPGVEDSPGLGERMTKLETTTSLVSLRLSDVQRSLHANGSWPLADALSAWFRSHP